MGERTEFAKNLRALLLRKIYGLLPLLASVADPNRDPHVFGPPRLGSGSISQRYGSGSGSFGH
jgi:hypothetical protein